MVAADEELLSDWLLRLEELASQGDNADVDLLIGQDESLRGQVASRLDLLPSLKRQFRAIRAMDGLLHVGGTRIFVDRAIPGYEMEAEIGRGGMGIVYRARHVALGRTVAVKMLIAGRFASTRLMHRFRKEAALIAGLQHQNIIQVYEVGESEGVPFVAIEFVTGGNLV
jgi:serine/threonine protein kinase